MLKMNKNFILLEEEGTLINLDEIAFMNITHNSDIRKYKLNIQLRHKSEMSICYSSLEDAEKRLHEIFKAIGAMK